MSSITDHNEKNCKFNLLYFSTFISSYISSTCERVVDMVRCSGHASRPIWLFFLFVPFYYYSCVLTFYFIIFFSFFVLFILHIHFIPCTHYYIVGPFFSMCRAVNELTALQVRFPGDPESANERSNVSSSWYHLAYPL